MKNNLFKRKNIHPDINYLELTPVCLYSHKIEEDGRVTVLMPKFKNKFLASFVPRGHSPYVNMHLDELGSAVWLSIDSKSNVGEIIGKLAAELGEKINPAEERIPKFLTQLYQNKFIDFKELS